MWTMDLAKERHHLFFFFLRHYVDLSDLKVSLSSIFFLPFFAFLVKLCYLLYGQPVFLGYL